MRINQFAIGILHDLVLQVTCEQGYYQTLSQLCLTLQHQPLKQPQFPAVDHPHPYFTQLQPTFQLLKPCHLQHHHRGQLLQVPQLSSELDPPLPGQIVVPTPLLRHYLQLTWQCHPPLPPLGQFLTPPPHQHHHLQLTQQCHPPPPHLGQFLTPPPHQHHHLQLTQQCHPPPPHLGQFLTPPPHQHHHLQLTQQCHPPPPHLRQLIIPPQLATIPPHQHHHLQVA
ncbi:RNA-binding protein 33-like [Macrosteles quadrilineatus]|uniref:RNA-binding protein 33-like n=1 Tax=Macrosteles quadrilineatus TaxID=74068 RepID=UPI0023E19235|nr:RNA-binding protein 33-like [Macrosteles quadrilineatus]